MGRKGLLLASLLLVCLLVVACSSNNQSHIRAMHDGMIITQLPFEGLYKQYTNLKNLEQEAELIIIGESITDLRSLTSSQSKATGKDPLGEFWVDTPFKITEVIKGDYEGEEISIAQPIFKEENQILTFQGYSPFLENAKYIVFLSKSEFGSGQDNEYTWSVLSFNYGKYNLDGNDTIEDVFSTRKQSKLKKRVVKKYGLE